MRLAAPVPFLTMMIPRNPIRLPSVRFTGAPRLPGPPTPLNQRTRSPATVGSALVVSCAVSLSALPSQGRQALATVIKYRLFPRTQRSLTAPPIGDLH